jgi:hypothetical protein
MALTKTETRIPDDVRHMRRLPTRLLVAVFVWTGSR